MSLPSIEQVEATIKEWAPMMRIADWQIDFAFASAREIRESCEGKPGNVAYCRRNRLVKQAAIEMDPEHWEVLADWQKVLAHEMYHIVTDDLIYHAETSVDFIPDETVRQTIENQINMYYERMVEDLAKGFIAALRKEAALIGDQETISQGQR